MKQAGNLLGLLAGQASIVAILALVLVLSIAGTPLLQQKKTVARHIGAEIALAKAEALSDALLAGGIDRPGLVNVNEQFHARHLPDALGNGAAPDGAGEAVSALRGDPTRPYWRFSSRDDTPHLEYAVADGAGGILLLDLPLDRERAIIGRFFGQSYLSASTVGFILIALLMFAAFVLRHYLRSLVRLPEDERRETILAGLESLPGRRRNLLFWLLGLCGVIFAADIANLLDSAVGIGYLLAVILALSSSRHWHVTVIAAASAVLMLASPILSPYDSDWWSYLETHSVAIFAIFATGFFGAANIRKSHAEALALAEAVRSRNETSELRAALERAEAAEAQKRAVVERMRMATESAGLSLWEWNVATDVARLEEGSPFVERLGGRRELRGTEFAERCVHPEDRSRWLEVFRQALRGSDDVIAHRYRLVFADGSVSCIQFHGRILRDAHGRPLSVLGIDWDVTEEEQQAQEIARQSESLREAQERFQRAISGTQDALFEFNLLSGETWYSPRFGQMLGYERDEPSAYHRLEAFVHPEDSAILGRAMADHLQHDLPYDVEYRLRRKDGEWLWVRSRASAQRDADGRPLWLAGSIRDITDERAARVALERASEEAEAASRAKSTFLATMSHEIRTPMNGIIGMTGLLLETGLDRAQRDYAETIRASADSLLTILNDVLDFSKIEAGKLDIETLELDLNSIVDDVGSIMAFQAAAKSLELVVNVRPEVPERVLGDPQRIRQCLLNLVGNAIKFTPRGEVVVEVCAVGRQRGRALVHFEVRDSGIGIARESLERLFQPFTQADSSTTRRFGGTGLGLSIVRKLIELMGGQAGAHSELGKGSTFWFTLPLEPAVISEGEAPRAAAPRGQRVLLVDDNETNRYVLTSQMTHAGYEVDSASSAREALAIMRAPGRGAFDIVVLDYQMPDLDGAALGDEIMRSPDIAPTRLVLLTSLDRSGDMQRFADIGFSAYLTKPVRTRELLDCLGRALSRDAEDWHLRSQPIITRGTLVAAETRRRYSGRVLLVEDNTINQRVARRFLERLGCEVDVVGDGLEAVEAVQRERYAFILMDMQMPVMDGLEATRRIRELEHTSTRTPIVALTANAMMGTLERCLEAGMDDYLTKPLDIQRLEDVLDRFVARSDNSEPRPIAHAPAQNGLRNRLTDIAGDDPQFIAELIETFLAGSEETLQELDTAQRRNDLDALARAAHKLKGACANLHMEALAALMLEIETHARQHAVRDWHADLARVHAEFAQLSETVRAEFAPELSRKAG